MRLIFIILALFISNTVFADISESSKKLEKLRLKAINNPSQKNKLAYLKLFPKEFKKFYFTFYGEKYLKFGLEYQ